MSFLNKISKQHQQEQMARHRQLNSNSELSQYSVASARQANSKDSATGSQDKHREVENSDLNEYGLMQQDAAAANYLATNPNVAG